MSTDTPQTALPPGFHVLNDGPGREVLIDERTDDPAPVFSTIEAAAETAWRWWREIYEPDLEEESENG